MQPNIIQSVLMLESEGELPMNKKQLVMANLAALFLLTLVFTPMSGQQTGSYEPWLDYNEDGKIDVLDLSSLSQAYGSSGDPTKNVTIVRHETRLVKSAVSVSVPPSTSWDSGLLWIDGYSKVTVLIHVNPASSTLNYLYLYAYDYAGEAGAQWTIEVTNNIGTSWIKTYDVMNQQIKILFNNNSADTLILDVDVYLLA